MVEIVIVVGILVLLIGMIIPVANGVIEGHRGKLTMKRLEVIAAALEEFRRANDLPAGWTLPPDDFDPANDWKNLKDNNPPFTVTVGGTTYRCPSINGATGVVTDPAGQTPMENAPVGTDPRTGELYDHRSIESLYLYLTLTCDSAAAIIADVPTANRDQCVGGGACEDFLVRQFVPAGGGASIVEQVAMREFIDAWGRPMRYTTTVQPAARVRWEIRSAGPDGAFGDPFSPELETDDIVVNGE